MNKRSFLLRGVPGLLLVLGAGFVMASSKDLKAALGMGAAVLAALVLSSIVISAIHKIIPGHGKLPCYVLIITGFVSLICMLMEAYFPEIVNSLGVHLAALSVSAVIYRDADEISGKNGGWYSIETAAVTGIFFTVIMAVCAIIREFFGSGAFFGIKLDFMKDYTVGALVSAFGGYLVLAIVLAVIQKISKYEHSEEEE